MLDAYPLVVAQDGAYRHAHDVWVCGLRNLMTAAYIAHVSIYWIKECNLMTKGGREGTPAVSSS